MDQQQTPLKRRKLNINHPDAHSLENQPWVEKYRPKNLDEISSQEQIVKFLKKNLKKNSNLSHMLFYGPPGTGKTSTILSLSKEIFGLNLYKSRILELNASDERGISIVRNKVKNFARLNLSNPTEEDLKNYPCPPFKIIILDEADSMTIDAQSALRRIMERYSNLTRFVLICNYVTKIIDPLASRCSKFRFKSLNEFNAIDRLNYISDNENLKFKSDEDKNSVFKNLLKISNGDLRKAITILQSSSIISNSVDDPVTSEKINELSGVLPLENLSQLTDHINNKDQKSLIKFINDDFIKASWSLSSILIQLHDYYIINENSSINFSNNIKNKISKILFETDSKLTSGTNEHIQLLSCVLNISNIITNDGK